MGSERNTDDIAIALTHIGKVLERIAVALETRPTSPITGGPVPAPLPTSPGMTAEREDHLDGEWARLGELVAERKRAGASPEELKRLRRRRAQISKELAAAREVRDRLMDAWEKGLPETLRRQYAELLERIRGPLRNLLPAKERIQARPQRAARKKEEAEAWRALMEFQQRYGAP